MVVTANTIRVIVKRMKCAKGSFRIKAISPRKGIKALFCCPQRKFRRGKCSEGVKMVTVIYDRKKWTPSKAKRNAKRFKRR